jgi:hypothetical protein
LFADVAAVLSLLIPMNGVLKLDGGIGMWYLGGEGWVWKLDFIEYLL